MKRFNKILALVLAGLLVYSSIRFIFLRPKPVLAADVLISMNEGYGTSSAVNDSSGSVSAGSITGATWKAEELCKAGKCLFFDGTQDYVSFSDDADLDFAGSDSFTINVWFRHAPKSSGTDIIVGKILNSDNDGGYQIQMESDGDITCEIEDTDADVDIDDSITSTAATYDDNQWHFISCVKSGTTSLTLFIDGNQIAQDASLDGSGTLANDDTLYIGIDGDGTSNDYTGFIDEVKVYRSLRTAAEIKADYLRETPSRGTAASFGPDQRYLSQGLVGYWTVDESSGNASDSSGNGLTLTNNGTTTFVSGKFGNGSEHVPASSQYFSTATTISGVKTVSFWTNPDVTTNYFVGLTSGASITASSGTISATGFTDPIIYVNGTVSTTLTQDVWQMVTVTTETAIDADLFYAGRQDTNYYDGTLDNIRVYNRALTPAEIENVYHWAPGPIAHYKLDEATGTSVNDSSGNWTGITWSGTGNHWTNGVYGSAGQFNGTDDRIVVGNISSKLNLTSTDPPSFALSAWMKAEAGITNGSGIKLNVSGAGGNGRILFRTTGCPSNPCFSFQLKSGGAVSSQTTAASYGVWYHVAGIWNQSNHTQYVYINGVLQDSDVPASYDLSVNAMNFEIGYNQFYFKGGIDDVRVYNYVRTPAQVIEDMNAGHPAPGSPVGSAVAYWKFDEGYATTAYDASKSTGGSEDLTLSSASWTNSGKFGKAFNGLTNVRASRNTDSDLEFSATEDFTLSLWYKSDSASNPGATEYLINDGAAAGSAGYAMYANTSGNLCFGIDDDTTWGPDVASCTTTDVYDNTWHHITAVRNVTSDTTKIYLDAVENDSDTDTTTATLDSSPTFYIGDANATDGTDEFLGDIDEVQIFRSALTRDQVKVLFNQNSGQQLGTLSTDASNNPSNSANDEYCPPGQGSACTAPIGHWKMDENTGTTAFDVSGNNNSGTLTNSPGYAPGKFGSGITFSGNDQHVVRADDSDFDFGASQPFTLETWFKHGTATVTEALITKLESSGTDGGFKLKMESDGDITCETEDDDADTAIDDTATTTAATYDDGNWHHVACVYDTTNTDLYIYIDGILTASDTSITTNSLDNDDALFYGIESAAGTEDWIGQLDDFRFYNYARTSAQIAWDYNRGMPVGWFRFDEGSGTTANDASGFGNTWTLSASSWSMGKRNGAWDGDGAKWVSRTDDPDFDFSLTEDFSISLWFKSDSTTNPSVNEYLVHKSFSGGTQNAGYAMYSKSDSSGNICFGIDDDTTWNPDVETCTSVDLYDTTWHHIVAYRSVVNDAMYVVVDGRTDTNAVDTTAATLENSRVMYFGDRDGTDNGDELNGDLDDIRIYRYALTSQQIKTVMSEGALRFGPETGSP